MAEGHTLGGLHHVTAIAGPPARNLEFYTRVLGMRLVKKTVNFDDPTTYHLYYGDAQGRPGSVLTFFPWAHAVKGRWGTGMVSATALEVPLDSLDGWGDVLASAGVSSLARRHRFGQEVLTFEDPHGLQLELVATERAAEITEGSDVRVGTDRPDRADRPDRPAGPSGRNVRGFHSVTLGVASAAPTVKLLADVFGFQQVEESEERIRLRAPGSDRGDGVDVLKQMEKSSGRLGAGTVHHVAFRATGEEEQLAWKERLESAGYSVTAVKDRQYFKSVYFREPGGVLFEIATDVPGFTLDEPIDELGTSLKLPPWLEPRREYIENTLDDLPSQD